MKPRRRCWSPLTAALLAASGLAQDFGIGKDAWKSFDTAAVELGRAARAPECNELLALLAKLGMAGKERDALATRVFKELDRARKQGPTTRAAKALRAGVAAVAARLPECAEADRRQLAELLLLLDGGLGVAHEVLGHERHDGVYAMPGSARRTEGMRVLQEQLAAARTLPFTVTVATSDQPALTAALGHPGDAASCGGMALHTGFGPEKTRRMLTQVLRAAAFVNVLHRGTLEVPDYGGQVCVVLPLRSHYLAAIDAVASAHGIGADEVRAAKADGMYSWRFTSLRPNLMLLSLQTEADIEVMWLSTLEYWTSKLPGVHIGRIEYANRAVLGQPMARMAEIVDRQAGKPAAGTRASDEALAAEREQVFALSAAGVRGGRRWLQWLTAHGEDPPWQSGLREQMFAITNDERIKAMFLAEFLFCEGKLVDLEVKAEAADGATPPTMRQVELLAQALGEPLPALEQRFDAALLGAGVGLLQRLEATPPARPRDETAALAALMEIRLAAGLTQPVLADDELSDGCRAHARYLGAHEEQTTRWPDMHEEYPDRPEWSAEGSMAGLASVVIAGTSSERAALDGWMGTFYHRLPLLDPGLRRIGYARQGTVAVLDAGSMVDPLDAARDLVVVWPPDGHKGVPVSFADPELPNPVPDQDQSRFGYPITVQYSRRNSERPVQLRLTLRKGSKTGPEVPCWFSSPEQPGNPVLAPANAACLIPKEPLDRGATYWVEAAFVGEAAPVIWSFQT